MMHGNLTLLFLLFISVTKAQYQPDAGIIPSLTEHATFSASNGYNLKFVNDHNINTFWESTSALPNNYIAVPELNSMVSIVDPKMSERFSAAFDRNTDTKVAVSERQSDAKFRFTIPFASPTRLLVCSIKLNVADTVKIFIETTHNFQLLTQFLPKDSYLLKSVMLHDPDDVKSISLACNAPFDIFEIAALTNLPTVFVEADFHAVVEIGQIYTRHLSGKNVLKSEIQVSTDHKNWEKIIELQPQAIAIVPIVLNSTVQARFLRLVHTLDLSDNGKAMVWELKVYDRYGPYGEAEPLLVNLNTMHNRIGLNGFWGWGFNTNSENIPLMQGADKYHQIGNLARSYHNMNWDIVKPGNDAHYDAMDINGTTVHNWLNWDKEYSNWKNAGFLIDASIQFQQVTMADTCWKRPFEDAYKYGFAYADHFGNKMQLIDRVEVGNEPWDYPAGFYNQILLGMATGLKDAKSSIKVFPAAFQATFRAYEKYEYDNYIGSKLDSKSLEKLDGLNGHFYSHTFDEQGIRISVSPEDQRSELLGIRNLSKFRNVNLPNKPLIITEFGYDSDGGGESCDHQECVTESQQAAWGLRAALLLLRNNADAVYWYYFANENRNSVLHARSGLCSSASQSFIPKKSFLVFAEFQQLLGDCILKRILAETPAFYCYLFENQLNKSTFAVIWAINNDNPKIITRIKFTFPSEATAIQYLDDDTIEWLPFSSSKREQTFPINGFPAIVKLK